MLVAEATCASRLLFTFFSIFFLIRAFVLRANSMSREAAATGVACSSNIASRCGDVCKKPEQRFSQLKRSCRQLKLVVQAAKATLIGPAETKADSSN